MKLKHEFENTIVIEKSRFITYLSRITSEEDAKDYIKKIRKMHPDANHHCSAFVCYPNNILQRSNDDGEPKGTAGSPMLNVLNKYGIEDTIAVVVRYFGGIKLGAGGLIRAYSNSVSEALDKAAKTESFKFRKYELTVPYELNSRIEFYMRNNTEKFDVDYDLECSYTFLTDNENIDRDIAELTSGSRSLTYLGDEIIEKDV